MQHPPPYFVGRRVSFDSFLGTIRYIGPVEGTNREWLGVEWDNGTRGRNNGTHEGVRYFTCQSPLPNCASFISVKKVPDPEFSFVDAVVDKYAGDTLEASASDPGWIMISGKLVENVGFEKIRREQSQLKSLKHVLVDGYRIKTAEARQLYVRDTCPNIVELDLSRNLFDDFSEIIKICASLQKLRSLRLNGNRFKLSRFLLQLSEVAIRSVKELELDETKLPWEILAKLASVFPEMTTLSVCQNDYDAVTLPLLGPNITNLRLNDNSFRSLANLSLLADLPALRSLTLKGNLISTIGPTLHVFGLNLEYVDLSYNRINDWAFVDRLSEIFPGMTALRISSNPFYDIPTHDTNATPLADDVFMLIVARIGKLKTLNFSKISDLERTSAELFYLSLIGREMMKVPPEEEYKVTDLHQRYAELCSKHDVPVPVRKPADALDPDLLEARLIRFKFYLPANSMPLQAEPVLKVQHIPKEFDVYRVKGVVGKRFDLRPAHFRLIWLTGEFEFVPKGKDQGKSSEQATIGGPSKEGLQSDGTEPPSEAELSSALECKGVVKEKEVEIIDGTRPIGNVVDGMEAKVRIELIEEESDPTTPRVEYVDEGELGRSRNLLGYARGVFQFQRSQSS